MSSDKLISELCDIVLTEKDEINRNKAQEYIQRLTEEDIVELNKIDLQESKILSALLLKKVADYIELYKVSESKGTPFDFDSSGAFPLFVAFFEDTYKKLKGDQYPAVFTSVFDYIQGMSDHYRIFEKFYTVRSIETSAEILSNAKILAEEAVTKEINKTLNTALRTTTEKIQENANVAEHQAHRAQIQAEVAKEQAQNANEKAKTAAETAVAAAVKDRMSEVSIKITENSVTILGIFAGIVLTVVAGLFYSSSVLESVNAANYFRLISVAAIVGLVCYHLIALMFRSIEHIKNADTDITKLNCVDKIVSMFLIVVFAVSGILQFVFPMKNEEKNVVSSTTSIYAEVDVNANQDNSSSESAQDDENSVFESPSINDENSSIETSTNLN